MKNMNDKTIVFVCEHGAAKSIVASAYFNKLAAENGHEFRSIARGTHPDSDLPPMVVSGLANDGLAPSESVPQKLSFADVESAEHIVTFCELPKKYQGEATSELWDDVPGVSDGYETARDAIIEHVKQLIQSIANP
jgi:protein-tyrosine-phosphatase